MTKKQPEESNESSAVIRGFLISTSQINIRSILTEKLHSHNMGWEYKNTRLKKLKQHDVTYMPYIKKKPSY